MTATKQMFIALLLAGGCAVDADTSSTAHELGAHPILLPDTGTGQNREVLSSFDPLVVFLYDTYGNPVDGATVHFSAPLAGATSTFRFDGNTETDAEGRAELRPYANQIAGTYVVWASTDGADPMPFVLTNSAAPPALILPILGSDQSTSMGMPFPQPLTVEVRDNYGNVVEGAPVEFVAPTTQPTMRMDDGHTITDDEGRASVFAFAGEMMGTYTVMARVAGAPQIPFVLTNSGPVLGTPDLAHTTDVKVEMQPASIERAQTQSSFELQP